MALTIQSNVNSAKHEIYRTVISQCRALTEDESDLIACLANVSSLLKFSFDSFLWAGFYLTRPENPEELVVGPFQGRPACTRIPFGKGVCGTAAEKQETIIVDDVDKFPGHIVCDSLSRSEIVVPIVRNGRTYGVLDIDSDLPANFDHEDRKHLEDLVSILIPLFGNEH